MGRPTWANSCSRQNQIVELEAKLDATQGERESLAATLEAETKRHRQAGETMSGLRIENARLEERIANTERRADELRDQTTRFEGELARLAQQKEGPKQRKLL
jgi:predicted nuclease with TOPRIM domain